MKKGKAYIYILPSFVFLALFTYYPVLKSIYLSFFKWDLATPKKVFTGLQGYEKVFSDPLFWKVMKNTLLLAVQTIPFSIMLGLIFALLVQKGLKLLSIFRISIYYPTVLPTVAIATIWIFMLIPSQGLISHFLKIFGLGGIDLLSTPKYALTVLAIVSIWKQSSYFMVFYLAGLGNIPKELLEASSLDGANKWQTFWHITFPLLAPITLFVLVMSIINSVQWVDQVFMMTQGGPNNGTNILLYHIYESAFKFWDMGRASVLTVIQLAILLSLTVFTFKSIEKRTYYED